MAQQLAWPSSTAAIEEHALEAAGALGAAGAVEGEWQMEAATAADDGQAGSSASASGSASSWALKESEWRRAATRHVPARSGRAREHAFNKRLGPAARKNAGIGSGNALGTELAQACFRANTRRCTNEQCDGLCDELWQRRGPEGERGLCAWCRTREPSFDRPKHLRAQITMAEQLRSGDRRLVFDAADGHQGERVWRWPEEAEVCAAEAATRRAESMLANPPKRGRPKRA